MEEHPEIDDSWIEIEDKKNLMTHIKRLYNLKFPWADAALLKSMIKYHYTITVDKMDKDEYLSEKASSGTLGDFLENLG